MTRRMLADQAKEARAHAKCAMCDPTRDPTMPTRKRLGALKTSRHLKRRLAVKLRSKDRPAPEAEPPVAEPAWLDTCD